MDYFDSFIREAHSGWRWIVLLLIVVVIIKTLIGWLGKQSWTNLDSTLLRFSRIAVYVQVILGLILFLLLQKWSNIAFIGSHVVPALLAVGGIEFGAARAKKAAGNKKFMFAFIGFIIALVLVFGALGAVGGIFA